jgi:hypothetical protein
MYSIMPVPVIAPMEHPVSGLSRPRGVRKNTALLNGGTSLKLSEGGLSPVLEAHPGSPVDISGQPRPSLAESLSQRLYHGTDAEFAKFERKARMTGKNKNGIRRDGAAAKGNISVRNREENENENCRFKMMQVAGGQPFYIPAKITEQEETPRPGTPSEEPSRRLSVDTEMAMQFDFKTENGMWISANPLASESRSSLATTTSYMTNSTITGDGMSRGAMTVDTSVASSAASMMSSVGSIQSAITTASSDIYGWEEDFDRKGSIESTVSWEREIQPARPGGGRTPIPRTRSDFQYKRPDTKKKSLLYRVLNLTGPRRPSVDDIAPVPPVVRADLSVSSNGLSTPSA